MYESIKGKLIAKEPTYAVLETTHIAYRILIPFNAFTTLQEGTVTLYISFIVREDGHYLYGFPTKYERDLFDLLITISGIGPKTALALVGHMDAQTFQAAITSGNTTLLSKIPGIGKKTAERLVIEMRDKFKKLPQQKLPAGSDSVLTDGINALIFLGYTPQQAQKAISRAMEEKKGEKDLSKIIAKALQMI